MRVLVPIATEEGAAHATGVESRNLIACWTLVGDDWELLGNKTGATRLGFGLLLKFFELEARLPRQPSTQSTAAVPTVATRRQGRVFCTAMIPAKNAVQVRLMTRYPAVNSNGDSGGRLRVIREYSAMVGATDGSIISRRIAASLAVVVAEPGRPVTQAAHAAAVP